MYAYSKTLQCLMVQKHVPILWWRWGGSEGILYMRVPEKCYNKRLWKRHETNLTD
jgi:hypothetical protein